MSETPNNNPEPAIIEKVVDAAKNGKELQLNEGDLAEVLDKDDMVRARAEATLKTREQWLALRDIVNVDPTDANKSVLEDEGSKEGLAAIERQIDDALKVPDVVSVETPPEPGEAKTIVEKIKSAIDGVGTSTISMLVRGWISLQRTLMSLGVMEGSPQQLDAIEKLYGKFFGASEAAEKSAALLKGAGINVVKDKKDSSAYFELKKDYLTKLNGRLQGKSPELQSMEKEQYTFDAYLAEKTGEYAASHAGKNGDTTLTGILKNQRPAESANKNN